MTPLSSRDVELLRHLAVGKSTTQLAAAMSVTNNTVRTRLRRIEFKLGVTGREQLVRQLQELGDS